MKKILLFSLVLLTLVFGITAAQDDSLIVDATAELGAISPYVYGVNFGFDSIIPPDMMPLGQALGVKYMRLGSGTSDQQDLSEIIIDLLVLQAKQMGAEPAVTVRLYGGTPEKAAHLVEYANIDKGYNIRYWSIGNEPNIFVGSVRAPSYTVEDLNRDWRPIAEAMLAVDPTITLVGPDITQYAVQNATSNPIEHLPGSVGGIPLDSAGNDWLQGFLKANGDLLGVVSVHRYPFGYKRGTTIITPAIDDLRVNAQEWDTFIPNLREVIRSAAGRDIPIAITEINSNSIPSSGSDAGTDSLYNAVWLADVLGHLIRQQVDIVSYWNLRSKGAGFGLIGIEDVRPTYYVYILYKQFGDQLVQSSWTDPDVSIYAAKRKDGRLTLMVVNLGPDEKTKLLQLTGFTPSGDAEVWRLDATHSAEQVDAEDVSSSITVPRQSVTLYVVPGE